MSDYTDAQIDAFAARGELEAVLFRIVAAELKAESSDPLPPRMNVTLGGGKHADGHRDGFTVSLNVVVETHGGRAEVEPTAVYAFTPLPGQPFDKDLASAFASKVAVVDLIPFAREALSDISFKVLQEHIVMPMFPRGTLSIKFDDAATGPK